MTNFILHNLVVSWLVHGFEHVELFHLLYAHIQTKSWYTKVDTVSNLYFDFDFDFDFETPLKMQKNIVDPTGKTLKLYVFNLPGRFVEHMSM